MVKQSVIKENKLLMHSTAWIKSQKPLGLIYCLLSVMLSSHKTAMSIMQDKKSHTKREHMIPFL